jgi:phospholipid/cholesterol/gamma-HCH transport system ATP-binding protein
VTSIELGPVGEPGITLDRVQFGYDSEPILKELSWELDQGQNAVVTGGSGSGKSTLLQIAAGLLPPQKGAVLLGGRPLSRLTPSQRVRQGVRTGVVFQDGGLFSNQDVFSNVSLALLYHQDVFELSDDDVKQRTKEALQAAQIGRSYWQTLPAHLPFGDRKRLALARAIAVRPNFFYFDDPDIGTDQRTAKVTTQLLCQLRDDPDVTLMVATNRTRLVDQLGVPGFRLENGNLRRDDRTSAAPPSWPDPR